MNYTKKLNLLDDFLTFYCNEILSTLQYINGYDFTDNKSQLENLPKSITVEANKKTLCFSCEKQSCHTNV